MLVPRTELSDWTLLSRSLFCLCVQILSVLRKDQTAQWGTIVCSSGSAKIMLGSADGICKASATAFLYSSLDPLAAVWTRKLLRAVELTGFRFLLLWSCVSAPWSARRLWWKPLKLKKLFPIALQFSRASRLLFSCWFYVQITWKRHGDWILSELLHSQN